MFVQVRLLKGYDEELLYEVPKHLRSLIAVGCFVQVPFRNQVKNAVVACVMAEKPVVRFAIRALNTVYVLPDDARCTPFYEKLAMLYFCDVRLLYARVQSFLFVQDEQADAALLEPPATEQVYASPVLTAAQQEVVAAVRSDIMARKYGVTLLQGVTGSGKTEVYKELMRLVLERQESVIFLCPEVGLAMHLHKRLSAAFGEHMVGAWHAASSPAQREQVLAAAVAGKPCVVVGVHLPVLLPLKNIGLIIVDEEHDQGYEEKQYPRINTKHAALLRAQMYGIPIVLGSATPSVHTLHQVEQQGWRHCHLTERFQGSFPVVQHVILGKDKKRPHFWISKELLAGLQDTLFHGKQALVYLNRRGYGFFLQCNACGSTFSCTGCAVALAVHYAEEDLGGERFLECHYCTFRMRVPSACQECRAPTDQSKCRGIGTQQLVTILKKLLPNARIGRLDADVSKRKKEWRKNVDAFAAGELDIIVGTQLITKGFHFPSVVLVGVIWADSAVHFPVYNAHEVALQQLIQVIGRAGRGSLPGRAIVQSFDDHPLFRYLSETAYPAFCAGELEARQEFGYPPFARLIAVELCHADEEQVMRDAQHMKEVLAGRAPASVQVMGPSRPLRAQREGMHYRHITCRAQRYHELHEACAVLVGYAGKSRLQVYVL